MIRRAVLYLTIVILALPLMAQAPRLVLRIEVRGSVPAGIIISQSALVAGRYYSESDFDAAIARLRRLTFVHDARYALEDEALIIEVDGTTPLFFDVEALGARSDFDTERSTAAGGGARLFVGGGGVAEGRVMKLLADSDEQARRAELAYSYYGIAGTRLFASASVESLVVDDDEGFTTDPAWQLTLGYPLTVRQTITATAGGFGFSNERRFLGERLESQFDSRLLTLRWAYDTTDDPLFARRGSLITLAPGYGWEDSRFDGVAFPTPPGDPTFERRRSEGTFQTLGAEARTYWAVGRRGAFSAGFDASRREEEVDFQVGGDPPETAHRDFDTVRISAGYGYNFFDRSSPSGRARHRVEIGASVARRREDFGAGTFSVDEKALSAGYLFRKPFGTVRVNLTYGYQ